MIKNQAAMDAVANRVSRGTISSLVTMMMRPPRLPVERIFREVTGG